MANGITSTGFNTKAYTEIVSEFESDIKGLLGDSVNTTASSIIGTLLRTAADQDAEQWEVIQSIYNALNPATATGRALDMLASQRGVYRLPATNAVATLTFTVDQTTTIPAGTIVSVSGAPSQRFQTISALTVTLTPPDETTTGTVEARALESGPLVVAIGALSVMESTVSGVVSASNAAAVNDGSFQETDVDLRIRMDKSFSSQGSATVSALRTALLAIPSVTSVTIDEGLVNPTNANGVPLGFIEVIVEGAADAATKNAVAQVLYDKVGAGVGLYSFSDDSGTATDPVTGDTYTMAFTRPTDNALDIRLDIDTDDTFAGYAAATSTLTNYLATLPIGHDLIVSKLESVINGMQGVIDITSLEWRLTTPPDGTYSSANRESAPRDKYSVTVSESV